MNTKPILFFDGKCPLCRSIVHFLLKQDKNKAFFFAPLQGETAKNILEEDEYLNLRTVILYENHHRYIKSDAVLEVFKRLGPPLSFLSYFSFLPKNFRDFIYQIIAKYRYRVFGELSLEDSNSIGQRHYPNKAGIFKNERILN